MHPLAFLKYTLTSHLELLKTFSFSRVKAQNRHRPSSTSLGQAKQIVIGCIIIARKTQAVASDLKLTGLCLANNLHFKMDKLSKDQKDEFAVSYAILALYDGGVSDQKIHFVFSRSGSMKDATKTPQCTGACTSFL